MFNSLKKKLIFIPNVREIIETNKNRGVTVRKTDVERSDLNVDFDSTMVSMAASH